MNLDFAFTNLPRRRWIGAPKVFGFWTEAMFLEEVDGKVVMGVVVLHYTTATIEFANGLESKTKTAGSSPFE